MSPTLYASFTDPAKAESAVGALLDHGVRPEFISLIASDPEKLQGGVFGRKQLDFSAPMTISGNDYQRTQDPLGNDTRTGPNARVEGGNVNEADFNPARGDFQPTGSPSPTKLGSAPIEASGQSDKKVEANPTTQTGIDPNVRENIAESGNRANAVEPQMGRATEVDVVTNKGIFGDPNQPASVGATPGVDSRSEGPQTPPYDSEQAAKKGVTTTTAGDAAVGAVKGAGIGLGVGAAAALAALAIPGFGLVLGGGALAAALAGVAATVGAGAVAGGVTGFLVDQGVDEADAPRYAKIYQDGGAVLAITLAGPETEKQMVEGVLAKYGATDVESYGAYLA